MEPGAVDFEYIAAAQRARHRRSEAQPTTDSRARLAGCEATERGPSEPRGRARRTCKLPLLPGRLVPTADTDWPGRAPCARAVARSCNTARAVRAGTWFDGARRFLFVHPRICGRGTRATTEKSLPGDGDATIPRQRSARELTLEQGVSQRDPTPRITCLMTRPRSSAVQQPRRMKRPKRPCIVARARSAASRITRFSRITWPSRFGSGRGRMSCR
jgi:hypothetical protein